MLYISNFFVNHKEAVSNQIELLRSKTGAKLLAAGIFMDQDHLQTFDLMNDRIILPESVYNEVLPVFAEYTKNGIHYFEEEPDASRRHYFNKSKSNLYISLYRRPTPEYVEHLKEYKNLKKVFVELEEHKKFLIKMGISEDKAVVVHTPGLFLPEKNQKIFNQDNINIVFASWNDGTYQALDDRGILFLVNLIDKNKNCTLTIPLRDSKTDLLIEILKEKNLLDRVKLFHPKDREELLQMYKDCDFVAFTSKKRVTKDVPNSIIDGILCGKPSIVSTTIDYHTTVKDFDFGIVITDHDEIPDLKVSNQIYNSWSENASKQALKHTEQAYLSILEHYETSDLENIIF